MVSFQFTRSNLVYHTGGQSPEPACAAPYFRNTDFRVAIKKQKSSVNYYNRIILAEEHEGLNYVYTGVCLDNAICFG